jgi:DNA-binding CsgD family transcriptional regulator
VPKTDDVDDRELVRQALARLPSRQREVLLLRYYQDLSEAEIAKRLGCAPGTVKSSAARALRALRDMLPEYESAGVDCFPVPPAAGQRTGPRPVLRGVVRRAAPGDGVVAAAESA